MLLEEYGHFVDAQVNEGDSSGDEGAIFSALVMGQSLDADSLQTLKAEDDTAVISLDSQSTIQVETNTDNFGTWKIERTGVNLPVGQIVTLNSIDFYSSDRYAFIPAAKITAPNGSSSIIYYTPFYLPYDSEFYGLRRRVDYSFQTIPSGVEIEIIFTNWPFGYSLPSQIFRDAWTLVSSITLTPQANGKYAKEFFEARGTKQTSIDAIRLHNGTYVQGYVQGSPQVGSIGLPIGSDPNYYTRSTQTDLSLNLSVNDNNQVSPDLEVILESLWQTTLSRNDYLMQPHYGAYYSQIAGDSFISANLLDITSNNSLVGIGSEYQTTYTFNLNNSETESITNSQLKVTIPKGINVWYSPMSRQQKSKFKK